jgi:metallo-beta-lactamase family protein
LIQGRREDEEANVEPLPFDVETLDAVVLSHAHLDHSGRLPKLINDGYRGSIYMTAATCDLLEVMLKDAAFLMERDVEWKNKHRRRAGRPEVEPLFTLDDVETTLARCQGVAYGRRHEIADGVDVCFRDAGHILGSAIVELYVRDRQEARKVVFSGDLGNSCAALLRDPEIVHEADVVLLESTYGDRNHRPLEETLDEFQEVFAAAAQEDGNVLIPAFAVGRTQEILFRLGELYQARALQQQLVFLDSPMGIAATEIYHRYQNVFNAEDSAQLLRVDSGSLHTFLPTLRYSRSTEESMAINRISGGAVIIAGSGMCNGGRIRHHLKHNLWRQNAHILIVGYQAQGTPGRALVDGTTRLRVAGEEVAVRATIHTLGGFSAHAGQSQLLEWATGFTTPRPRLYLVHGEDDKKELLQELFTTQGGWDVAIPALGETITI